MLEISVKKKKKKPNSLNFIPNKKAFTGWTEKRSLSPKENNS